MDAPLSFAWPAMLASLLLLPLVAALYVRAQRRRRLLAERYAGFGLARPAAGAVPAWRRRLPPALFLAALALLCLSLARPQATLSLPRLEGTVVLTFDVSGSMAATDVEPNRMEAAKAAAEAFVRDQPPTARIGVVAFSDGGLAVQAPTGDQASVLAAIERLRPERGTSLGEGILAALTTIASGERQGAAAEPLATPTPAPSGRYLPAAIVLLSDGENNAEPDPLAVAQAAAQLGVRIYTVGLGSAEGVTLQLDGFSVHSRLEEEALQQIAALTGGSYFSAQDGAELQRIYDEVAAQLVVRQEPTEITALLVGAALLLLLVGGVCSFLWFNRLA